MLAVRLFGQDHARTLEHWRARLLEPRDDVAGLGFDQVFRRMWAFHLACSEAGFPSRLRPCPAVFLRPGLTDTTRSGDRASPSAERAV
ncbi:class I SAM-dependent methyltransferase [Prauserella muralis]|uniref:class I SAM-dependent methyltransferase n=1 Tax=Prauserella muralis TaxID=588067 RepID=UPI00319E2AFE